MNLERVERKIDRFSRVTEKVSNAMSRIPDIVANAGAAYYGYAAGEEAGAITALIGMKLAQANNMPAGLAGTGVLAALGLTNAWKKSGWEPEEWQPVPTRVKQALETIEETGDAPVSAGAKGLGRLNWNLLPKWWKDYLKSLSEG